MTSPLVREAAHLGWRCSAKWLRIRDSTAPKASCRGSSQMLLCRDQIHLNVNMTAETDRPSVQPHYFFLHFTEGHVRSSKIWSSQRNGRSCSTRQLQLRDITLKWDWGYFSSTIPLQRCSRVHLDKCFHSRFIATFATLGFVARAAVLSAASHSTPPDFAPSAARALPDVLKSTSTLMPTH